MKTLWGDDPDPNGVERIEGFRKEAAERRQERAGLMSVRLKFDPQKVVRFTLPPIDLVAYHVYVVWSRADPTEVLYVGRAISVFARLGQHIRARVPWVDDIGEIELYEFATKAESYHGEAVLIERLRPRYNVVVPYVVNGQFGGWTPKP